MSLTIPEIAGYARQAGVPENQVPTATAIAMAESGGDAAAFSAPNRNGTIDRGLWQINSVHAQYPDATMRDPVHNARAMFALSRGGRDWSPWTTFTQANNSYRAFLPQVQKALASPMAQSTSSSSTSAPDANGFAAPGVAFNDRNAALRASLIQGLAGAIGARSPSVMFTPNAGAANALGMMPAPPPNIYGIGSSVARAPSLFEMLSNLSGQVGANTVSQDDRAILAAKEARASTQPVADFLQSRPFVPLTTPTITSAPYGAPAFPTHAYAEIPTRPAPGSSPLGAGLAMLAGLVDPRHAGAYGATPLEAATGVASQQYDDNLRRYGAATQQYGQQYQDALQAHNAQVQTDLYNRGVDRENAVYNNQQDRENQIYNAQQGFARGLAGARETGALAGQDALLDPTTGLPVLAGRDAAALGAGRKIGLLDQAVADAERQNQLGMANDNRRLGLLNALIGQDSNQNYREANINSRNRGQDLRAGIPVGSAPTVSVGGRWATTASADAAKNPSNVADLRPNAANGFSITEGEMRDDRVQKAVKAYNDAVGQHNQLETLYAQHSAAHKLHDAQTVGAAILQTTPDMEEKGINLHRLIASLRTQTPAAVGNSNLPARAEARNAFPFSQPTLYPMPADPNALAHNFLSGLRNYSPKHRSPTGK